MGTMTIYGSQNSTSGSMDFSSMFYSSLGHHFCKQGQRVSHTSEAGWLCSLTIVRLVVD